MSKYWHFFGKSILVKTFQWKESAFYNGTTTYVTFVATPETTVFADADATDFTAEPTRDDAAPATAGMAALATLLAALALADANKWITMIGVNFVQEIKIGS